jgi:predicted Kef-type K+ transport protein
MEIAFLVAALVLGLAARAVRLPPLVGYLAAGFVLHGFGYESTETIEAIAEIGILLLLFGIGLKLELRTLTRPPVWGTATTFAIVITAVIAASLLGLGALGTPLARQLDLGTAVLVGFALSFSSTVFAVKALEETGESASLSGRLAVGVLILQDIFAVAFLVAVGSGPPSPWALLVVPAIFLLKPVFGWLLDRSDHGEILVLLGFALAVGIGAGSFELVGLKPDLGALVAGLMLSGHSRAGEMADRLLGFKDLFLIGFFLSIGLGGTPSPSAWAIGVLALLLVGGKTAGFFLLFTRFRLRARTALHGALTLSTYSEFGLIVAAAALSAGLLDQQWVSTIAVAVALSFVVVSAVSAARYWIYQRWSVRLTAFERHPPLPEDAIIECGNARVLIFGMGRVGAGAYDEMVIRRGSLVVGVDRSQSTVDSHHRMGRSVIRGDALDRDFWERVRFHPEVDLVIAAMNSHTANLECVKRVKEFVPKARVAAIAQYSDQVAELRSAGVDVARNLYEEAGQGLADDAVAFLVGDDR